MSYDCDCPDGGHNDGTGTCLCGGTLHTEIARLQRRAMTTSYEEVLQHLLAAHGEHLRTTESDPLSLGDFVTLNYVNPLYARAKAHAEAHPERVIRFRGRPVEDESRGHH